jgi:hypothetical protein
LKPKEIIEMSDAYRASFSFGTTNPEGCCHFHEVALREARIASEYHHGEPVTSMRERALTRLRFAFARPAEPEACNCPA